MTRCVSPSALPPRFSACRHPRTYGRELSRRSLCCDIGTHPRLQMALAQWELNGRQVGQLWMLSEHALLQQCEIYGVPLPPPEEQQLPKPKLIAILAKALRQLDKGRLLTDGSAAMNTAAAEVDTARIAAPASAAESGIITQEPPGQLGTQAASP